MATLSKSDMTEKSPLRRRPPAIRLSVVLLKFILAQWQVLGIGIAVLLAYLFPNVARRGGIIESQYAPKTSFH